MENREQVLERAIVKAVENGWEPEWSDIKFKSELELGISHRFEGEPNDCIRIFRGCDWVEYGLYNILFNHNFAKALFGRRHVCLGCYAGDDDKYMRTKFSTHGLTCLDCDGLDHEPRWMYHIKRMVISEDPIKYMSDNITSLHDFKIPKQSKNI